MNNTPIRLLEPANPWQSLYCKNKHGYYAVTHPIHTRNGVLVIKLIDWKSHGIFNAFIPPLLTSSIVCHQQNVWNVVIANKVQPQLSKPSLSVYSIIQTIEPAKVQGKGMKCEAIVQCAHAQQNGILLLFMHACQRSLYKMFCQNGVVNVTNMKSMWVILSISDKITVQILNSNYSNYLLIWILRHLKLDKGVQVIEAGL